MIDVIPTDKHDTCHSHHQMNQGDHSPDTLKFPDCAALTPMLRGTHSMPVLLVLM